MTTYPIETYGLQRAMTEEETKLAYEYAEAATPWQVQPGIVSGYFSIGKKYPGGEKWIPIAGDADGAKAMAIANTTNDEMRAARVRAQLEGMFKASAESSATPKPEASNGMKETLPVPLKGE